MKKKVLVIIPDRFVKASGGMGENSGPIFRELSKDYDFYVAGFPLAGTEVPEYITEYKEVGLPFTEIQYSPLHTIIAQTMYFDAAIKFPMPDVIYAFDWSVYFAAARAAEFFKVPMIARMCLSPILLSEQGYRFGMNMENAAERAIHNAFCEMEIRGLKYAHRIVHVSEGYAKQYEHLAPNFKDKIRLVINGIDFEKWRDPSLVPAELPGSNKIKLVFLGRLSEMKGIIPLCKAKIPDNVDLIFVGDKEKADKVCWDAIEKKVMSSKNVFYAGPLYGTDKIRALRSAAGLIVPSYHEPFGGVGLEGLAAGCVVLSSRAGGLSDYLNDDTSIYCGMTPEKMEEAIIKLASLTDAQREAYRENGFKMCQKLTIDSASKQLGDIFAELTQ